MFSFFFFVVRSGFDSSFSRYLLVIIFHSGSVHFSYASLPTCTGDWPMAMCALRLGLGLVFSCCAPNQIKRTTTQKEKGKKKAVDGYHLSRTTGLPNFGWDSSFVPLSKFSIQKQIELVISDAKKQTSTCPKIQTSVTLHYLQSKVTSIAKSQSCR